jgi:zinc/manganese transport system substrate-binding protein
MNFLVFAIAALTLAASGVSSAAPISVVVAERVYGEAVERIGGDKVTLSAVAASLWADPHDYEPTPSAARLISDAQIVLYNGIGYDGWAERLAAASGSSSRIVISVAALLNRKSGDNPHLWYDPLAMPAVATALVNALSAIDPAGAAGYADRGRAYQAELATIDTRVAAVRAVYSGSPVTATEPVFGYMADALALDMRHLSFQRSVMNETEPAARDIAAIERDLRGAAVKLLFYNSQVTGALTERLLALAKAARIPVVGVTETQPPGMTYAQWMLSILNATEVALAPDRVPLAGTIIQ